MKAEDLGHLDEELTHPKTNVLLRDFSIFSVKLILDGLKDVVLLKLSLFAVLIDIVFGRRPHLFYMVLELSERFDLWLNLNGAARSAGSNEDGMFGESRAGDSTMVGKLEEWMRGKEAAS